MHVMARWALGAAGALVVGGCAAAPSPAEGAGPGDLDPRFGAGGTVTVDLGDVVEEATAVQALPDGDLLVATATSSMNNFSGPVVRLDADGGLDSAFGDGGLAATMPTGCAWCGRDMAVQPDGKILLAGASTYPTLWSTGVLRLNPDGTPDTGFGRGGLAGSANVYGVGEGVALQSDGKILVVSLGTEPTGAPALSVLRLLPDGTPDPAWGIDGLVEVPVGADPTNDTLTATDVLVQGDGKVVVAGSLGPRWEDVPARAVVARLLPDGTPDLAFGDAGLLATGSLIIPEELALQPDGRIVAAGEAPGETGTDFAVIRIAADGALDAGFGDAGRAVVRRQARGAAVAVRPDGRIVAAGDNTQLFGYHIDTEYVVAQLRPDGSPDPSFGTAGVATSNHYDGTEVEVARDLALQPDGKVVVGGQGPTPTADRDVTLDRYLAAAPPVVTVAAGACVGDGGADVALTLADADTPADQLSVTVTSSDPAVLADTDVTVGPGGPERTLAVRPDARATGTAVVTVTVDDGDATATADIAVALGGAGVDRSTGTAGADVVIGRSGGDVLAGGDGHDVVCGGRGSDSLDGGPGDDHLGGGAGDDVLTGGPGADAFAGGAGADAAVDASTAEGDVLSGVP